MKKIFVLTAFLIIISLMFAMSVSAAGTFRNFDVSDAAEVTPAAAQTADMFSVAIIMLAITSAASVVICRKNV